MESDTFEIHITVKTSDIERFRSDCASLGVKPIVLDLQNQIGYNVMQDVMTTSKTLDDNPYLVANSLSESLTSLGYQVLRVKIEAAPWSSQVPSYTNNLSVGIGCYFESHVRIRCAEQELVLLRSKCSGIGVHVSKNVLKKDLDGIVRNLITLRTYNGFIEDFKITNHFLSSLLEVWGFVVEKHELEYVMYDSNTNHDSAWTNKEI